MKKLLNEQDKLSLLVNLVMVLESAYFWQMQILSDLVGVSA